MCIAVFLTHLLKPFFLFQEASKMFSENLKIYKFYPLKTFSPINFLCSDFTSPHLWIQGEHGCKSYTKNWQLNDCVKNVCETNDFDMHSDTARCRSVNINRNLYGG